MSFVGKVARLNGLPLGQVALRNGSCPSISYKEWKMNSLICMSVPRAEGIGKELECCF